jgi:hypothetical protein
MASDDIERLLSEVNGTTSSPARATKAEVSTRSPGGRLAFAAVCAVGLGFLGWLGGVLLPFIDGFSCGVGAAGAAFVATLIAGPPRWFSS